MKMILYVHTRSASREVVGRADQHASALQCATVVLQHPGGPLGFEGGPGDDVIKALVHDVVVIERANSPAWRQLKVDAVSYRVLHFGSRRVVTCSAPLPGLLQELETVSSNHLQAKKNIILARHGKPQMLMAPTAFDDWIAPDDLLTERAAQWLIDSCQTLVLWRFSDWGVYASILARSSEEAVGPVLQTGETLHVPVRQVKSESELPAW